jgi:IS5 family transposase
MEKVFKIGGQFYPVIIGQFYAAIDRYDAAMKKAARGHKLGIIDILRNKRISRTRSHIERCFAVMKRGHNAGRVSVTTVARAGIKFMMNSIVYNLVQLKYLASIRST